MHPSWQPPHAATVPPEGWTRKVDTMLEQTVDGASETAANASSAGSEAKNPVTAAQLGLTQAVFEIERSASALGWDRASTVYALVPTKSLLELEELPADMRQQLEAGWDGSEHTLTAVIQEDLPGEDLEDTLAQLGWPESVVGAAVATERVMVPPEAEAEAPEDPTEAVEFFANHPDRDEVRIVAGVLRTGESWCAIRARSHDNDDEVAEGSNLVPSLVEALYTTFLSADERNSGGGCGSGCSCGSGGCGSGGYDEDDEECQGCGQCDHGHDH